MRIFIIPKSLVHQSALEIKKTVCKAFIRAYGKFIVILLAATVIRATPA